MPPETAKMLATSACLLSSLSVALATTSEIAALSSSLFSLCFHLCSLFPAKFAQLLRFKLSAPKHGLAQKAVVVHFASRDKINVGGRVGHGWFSFLASARALKALVQEPNSFSKQEQTNKEQENVQGLWLFVGDFSSFLKNADCSFVCRYLVAV